MVDVVYEVSVRSLSRRRFEFTLTVINDQGEQIYVTVDEQESDSLANAARRALPTVARTYLCRYEKIPAACPVETTSAVTARPGSLTDAAGSAHVPNGEDEAVTPWNPAATTDPRGVELPPGFVYVAPGTFRRGSPRGESGRQADEDEHRVTLRHAFILMSHEVTQELWLQLFDENPAHFSVCGRECPMENITWYSALAFANAWSEHDGLPPCYALSACQGSAAAGDLHACKVAVRGETGDPYACAGYRLPTEAEWELAARAGGRGPRHDADLPLDAVAWSRDNADGRTQLVRQKLPNRWGLYDMLGNVWEWCWDAYGPYPDAAVTDPVGDGDAATRVIRGGSWLSGAAHLRSAMRGINPAAARGNNVGFRMARTVE